MGDQIGNPGEGRLHYVPKMEVDRVLDALSGDAKVHVLAMMSRMNALYMIVRAGSGHIGSSFSCLDLVAWLHVEELSAADVFFSSKGHDAPGHYAALSALGKLEFDKVHHLRRLDGLPGHPDRSLEVCAANTGSLGMGISKAKGMLHAWRRQGKSGRVFVMTGDGELQEGQIWESLVSAANHQLENVYVIVDHNKLQSDTFVKATSDLGDLEAKFAAFGWAVGRCNGNDVGEIRAAMHRLASIPGKPHVLIADTIKGCGVSFMEHTSIDSDVDMYAFHSGAPKMDIYLNALQELRQRVDCTLAEYRIPPIQLQEVEIPAPGIPAPSVEKLIEAYTEELLQQASTHPELIALDADLILDTGLIPFKQQFPDQFLECGIAEQDMVSQAGGMALQGALPIVHSFACFLSARPNEQIYNNATEQTRIVYVGSLAGLLPGGPGHSHQAVRDIATLSAVPGLTLIQPGSQREVRMALDYAINQAPGSTYLRLVSIPCSIPWKLPEPYTLERGRGVVLREGSDVVIVAYGPVMLEQVWNAAARLDEQKISCRVINLPWLNELDPDWFQSVIMGRKLLVCVDDHYRDGGQGTFLLAQCARCHIPLPRVLHRGVDRVPVCGTAQEVLRAHRLDAESLAADIRQEFAADRP